MAEGTYGAPAVPDTRVVGRRAVAGALDVLLVGFVGGVLSAQGAVAQLLADGRITDGFSAFSFSTGSIAAAVFGLLYFAIMEGRYGQTFGKMALGIRVVREDDGRTPGVGVAVLRTLLRVVDGIGSYLVALVTILVSGKNRRLGDMAAKTLVVRA